MKPKIKIGLLEFGIRKNESNNPIQSIHETIEYAILADQLGFNRFWLTENYIKDRTDVAWSTPEMLLPIILGMTDNINVGIAGLIISTHNPFRIAHNYKLLNNIYPGRVDLGIVKGNLEHATIDRFGGNFQTSKNINSFILELLEYLRCEKSLLNDGIIIPPFLGEIPDIWYLGSSHHNFDYIIENKLNFGRTLFHDSVNQDYYLDEFKKFKLDYYNINKVEPKTVLAFSGYCDSSSSKNHSFITDSKIPLDAINIVGPPDFLYEKLLEYQDLYGYNEFIFNNTSVCQKKSLATLEKVAKFF